MGMAVMALIRKLTLSLLLLAAPAFAQTVAPIHGNCSEGKTAVVTQGLQSTNRVMASYPACTVAVYIHGGGLATIYSDSSLTALANPFTATTLGDPGSNGYGDWIFYAATGSPARYDVVMSGGQFGGFPAPYTIPDIQLGTSGGGGGGNCPAGLVNDVQLYGSPGNCNSDTGIFTENPSTHTVSDTIVQATQEVDVINASQAGEVDLSAGTLSASIPAGIVGITAPATSAAGVRYILPGAIGTDGQAIKQISHSGTNVTLGYGTIAGSVSYEDLIP